MPDTRVRRSAGILLFRRNTDVGIEVLLGHMGGPFWQRKESGAWSVPKGEPQAGEDDLVTARREFAEELGFPVPDGELLDLGEVRQSGGKTVRVFALEADPDLSAFSPGLFELEWPPRSGRRQSFPEVDRIAWCDRKEAEDRLVTAQRVFLERLAQLLP